MQRLIVALVIVLGGCRNAPATTAPAGNQQTPATNAAAAPGAGQTAGSGLTVLVPTDLARAEISQSPDVAVADNHYSISRQEEDLTFSLTGSLVNRAEASIDATPVKETATIRGVPVYVSENEGIKTATWIEKGTAYAMDIECSSANDNRCRTSDYILNRVGALLEKAR